MTVLNTYDQTPRGYENWHEVTNIPLYVSTVYFTDEKTKQYNDQQNSLS